ncbi:MAG: MarR family transcriptional regulator [Thermomicrobium sp.]|nr:MarR family transcriptional regulator [Thermomicrobium sp.]
MTVFDPEIRQHSRAARVAMALLRLSHAVKAISSDEVKGLGLTPMQAQVLLWIRYTKPFLTSVGRLAQALGVTHVTAIGIIDALEREGLLVREASRSDRRVTLLRLTSAGEAAVQRLERFGHTLEEALAEMDENELATLERGLGAVVWSLRAAGLLQVAEACRGCTYFRENVAPGTSEPHRCDLIERFLSEQEARLACPDYQPERSPAL